MADEEIRKALSDHQLKVIESVQKINMFDSQIETLQRSVTYSQITSDEMKSLPEGVNVFESVGRMFFQQSVADVHKILAEKKVTGESKIEALKNNKLRLEKGMKESEDYLRELLEQKKSQMA